MKQIIFDEWYAKIGNLLVEREVAEAVFGLLQKRILREVKHKRNRYRKALRKILQLRPEDTQEGYNEWGEAYCFQCAQDIAKDALEKAIHPIALPPSK